MNGKGSASRRADTVAIPSPKRDAIPKGLVAYFMGKRLGGFPIATFNLIGEQRVFQQIRGSGKSTTNFGFAQVVKTEPMDPKCSLQVFGDEGPFWTKTDDFNQPLTTATAGAMKRVVLANLEDLPHEFTAFFAFVAALPNDGIFVLYWTH